MPDFMAALSERVVLLDGAMGTQLAAHGLAAGRAPEAWVLDEPENIAAVHTSYLDAGAEAVLTCTFGATEWKLELAGLGGKGDDVNSAAAKIARDAAGPERFVLGDVGPTGRLMAPMGTASFEDFVEVFKKQVAPLADGGVDAIIVETMVDLQECLAAVSAARSVCELPVIASMSFGRDVGGGYHTVMGVGVADMVEALQGAGTDVVGSNCGVSIVDMIEIARGIVSAADRPVLVQPNAGSPRLEGGKTVYDETPDEMAAHFEELLQTGVAAVGSCCGTTPEHTRLFAELLRRRRG